MAFSKFSELSKGNESKDAASFGVAKPKILVIDDDPTILRAMEFTLQDKYAVHVCDNGTLGVSLVDEEVQVIILDIKMPEKDGFQIYEEIKSLHPLKPIIFYSAFQDLLDAITLRQKYKPFGYFDKNGQQDKLLERIDEAVKYHERLVKLDTMRRKLEKQNQTR